MMALLMFFSLLVASYAICFLAMKYALRHIVRLPRSIQLPLFVITAIVLLSPLFVALDFITVPIPGITFFVVAPLIGDTKEIYRVLGSTGPLNIIMPIITSILAYYVGPSMLSRKSSSRN